MMIIPATYRFSAHCSVRRKFGPGKIGPAGLILDVKTGPVGPILGMG